MEGLFEEERRQRRGREEGRDQSPGTRVVEQGEREKEREREEGRERRRERERGGGEVTRPTF